MLRRIRLGRHAGALYFAVACILAASLLMFRFRRPPVIIIEDAAGTSAAMTEGNAASASRLTNPDSGEESTAEAGSDKPDIRDDDPSSSGTDKPGLSGTGAQQELIYVHVAGQVAKPGLYGLPLGSRVHQAIEAAGGMTSKADRDSVNIALPVSDGQQVFIPALKLQSPASNASKSPAIGAAEPKMASGTEEKATETQIEAESGPQGRLDVTADEPEQEGVASAGEGIALRIDINTAGQAELEQLPGVGPSTAMKIIQYREANGPFTTIEGLMDVSGIGPAKFAAMKDMVVVR